MDIGEFFQPSTLEPIIKWTGVLVGLAGAILASPDGSRQFVRASWRWVRSLFGPRSPSVESATGQASGGVRTEGTAYGVKPWDEHTTLKTRIDMLLTRIEQLEGTLVQVKAELGNRIDSLGAQISELTSALDQAKQELHRRIDTNEKRAAEIDAFGLPVIGLGIFLSGVPDELAAAPWVGVPLTIVSIAAAIVVFALGIKRGAWSGKL
ncbi:hypothetical protein [Arthrobacter burdickii]|uniref:Uncharacterized protein n=1 Tax=Arthrobacter burdickii TaxID=3035920 RepID=A0ABT8K3S3_9MICC|nr:hypothetical protein [Arthrobacter burdickii]MDN4611461.1 hypothetical protein [Arthrobacter burdickii]